MGFHKVLIELNEINSIRNSACKYVRKTNSIAFVLAKSFFALSSAKIYQMIFKLSLLISWAFNFLIISTILV